MAMLDTLVHGETAFLAGVARKNTITQAVLGPAAGYPPGHIVHFDRPRVADYRASVPDIATALRRLLNDPPLRARMGAAGRARVVERFDYRLVARQLAGILTRHLGVE